ncbi:hypothetical protein PS834_00999 [Pseudomonas fluorescens]|nr:hypothetical protein PS834_00999 [Pseudomonas fluorescens]
MHRLCVFFEAAIGRSELFIQRSFAKAGHILMACDYRIDDGCLILEYGERLSSG